MKPRIHRTPLLSPGWLLPLLAASWLASAAGGAEAQTLASTRFASVDSIAIFVDGNVRKIFAQGGETDNASGTLGIRRWTDRTFVSAQISIAASSDTIRSRYGASLLTPSSGSALNSGIVTVSLSNAVFGWGPNIGLRSYVSVSTHLWALEQASTTDPLATEMRSFEVPVIGIGIGPSYSIASGSIDGGESVSIEVYGAGTFRGLFGDLATSSRDASKLTALGTTEEFFWGVEFGLQLKYGNINSGLTFYRIFGADVDGLSDGQVAAGVSISADLIRGVLN